MSYNISTLLTRNLHDVFGQNDPAFVGGKAGVTVALIALAPYCLTGAEVAACSISLAVSFGWET